MHSPPWQWRGGWHETPQPPQFTLLTSVLTH
jgi:hypothetical protein